MEKAARMRLLNRFCQVIWRDDRVKRSTKSITNIRTNNKIIIFELTKSFNSR